MSDLARVQENLEEYWPEIGKHETESERETAFFDFVEQMRDQEEINALRVIQQHKDEFPMIQLQNDWPEIVLQEFDPKD